MAAIAPPYVPPVAASSSPSSQDDLQSTLKQFLAASGGADTVGDVNDIFKSVTSHEGGAEWLQKALDAQHDDNLPERLMTQGIAERLSESCPADANIATTMTTCSTLLIVQSPVTKTGSIEFKGLFTPEVASTTGKFEYNPNTNLGDVSYAIVNAGQISVQIYLYRSGELVDIGSPVRNKIPANQGSITGW